MTDAGGIPSETPTRPLKLAALDAQDLAVLSAHLQDAVVKRSDMTFTPAGRRFGFACNRFDWVQAQGASAGLLARLTGRKATYLRRRSTVLFDHVTHAAMRGVDAGPDAVLSLLSLHAEPDGEGPHGAILLRFAGGGEVRLTVECVEARLEDSQTAWATHARPDHERSA